MDTDVLIVGAGPTGLMLANQLGRRGIRAHIIDRHDGPALQTRALGVQARTLEIYAKLGIIDQALALGKRGTGASLWSQGRNMARVPIGAAGEGITPYPYIYILGQDDNEKIMGDKLRDWNVAVQWNTELFALTQQDNYVTASLRQADGTTRTVNASWVAGCDGTHSAVRELTHITFPGASYEHIFFVADVIVTGNMTADEVNIFLWKQGFYLLFPMRGVDHWRIVGIVPIELRNSNVISFNDVIPSLRDKAGIDWSFKTCTWFSTYRIYHRRAAQFRNDRCFLLGDAAHIHSPVGAQGMNTGLQDAYNLGWKLSLVVKQQADKALLNSYNQERIPVAQRLLATTDQVFKFAVSDNWMTGVLRTQIFARIAAFAMHQRWIQRKVFRIVSQTAIHYRNGSLSKSSLPLPKAAPQAGDRFPWLQLKFSENRFVEDIFQKLDDLHFHLLIFGQLVSLEWLSSIYGELLQTHMIPEAMNKAELERVYIPCPSFYLLRQDGHIGFCGTQLDVKKVIEYMTDHLCITKPH